MAKKGKHAKGRGDSRKGKRQDINREESEENKETYDKNTIIKSLFQKSEDIEEKNILNKNTKSRLVEKNKSDDAKNESIEKNKSYNTKSKSIEKNKSYNTKSKSVEKNKLNNTKRESIEKNKSNNTTSKKNNIVKQSKSANQYKRNKKFNNKKINTKFLTKTVCIIICVIIIFICISIMNGNKEENTAQETKSETAEESIETVSVEEEPVEETVDTDIEQLISEIRTENELDVSNFYFFFYNIEKKKYYFYNENAYFTAASTIKVPVSMLYYDKIQNGEMNLANTLMYNRNDYEAGGGTTATDYKVGDSMPISYLLEQTIVNSDNTALNILMHNLGYQECKEEIAKYTDIKLIEDFYTSNVASASYYYDVLQHLYQNSEQYSTLIEHMKKSSGGEYLKANLPQYDVAHKYGSYNGYVHDYGIIYGENTYLVGVFTKNIENASELIAEIGQKVVECVEKENSGDTTVQTENTENANNTAINVSTDS